MKRILLYAIVVTASLLSVACHKETFSSLKEGGIKYSLWGTLETSGGAKTTIGDIDGHHFVFWTMGDAICTFDSEGNRVDMVTEECSGTRAKFSGKTDLEEFEPVYAIYPASENVELKDDFISFRLPAVQEYNGASFADEANVSIAKIENSESGKTAHFKNTCGFLMLQLTGSNMKVAKITLRGNNYEKLNGLFRADASLAEPVATAYGERTDGDDIITLDCGSGVVLDATEPKDFLFVLPVGALDAGLFATVYDENDKRINVDLTTRKSNTIARSNITKMPAFTANGLPGNYALYGYVQSNGKTYFDTNFNPKDGIGIAMKGVMLSNKINGTQIANNAEFCGCADFSSPVYIPWISIDWHEMYKNCRMAYNDRHIRPVPAVGLNEPLDIFTMIIKGATIYRTVINGKKYDSETQQPNTLPDGHLYLFGGYNTKLPSQVQLQSESRIYFFKIYDGNGKPARNYLPVFDVSKNAYGLYDMVNDKFYPTDSNLTYGFLPKPKDPSLVFESYEIAGGRNLGTFGNTICVAVNDAIDLTSVVSTFTTNASKVTVSGLIQNSGITANNMSNDIIYRLENEESYNEVKVRAFQYDQPIVFITTPTTDITKEEWVENVAVKVFNGATGDLDILGIKSEGDNPEINQIKGRGNSTWGYPKKPYTIKLNKAASVLDMPSDKRWNLLANWMDRTDIRNDIALQLGRVSPGLAWTPKGKFVELILNGEYNGNYYLCEHIKISKNRVNITAFDEDEPVKANNHGYLLEFDVGYDEANKFRSSLDLPVNVKDPDVENYDISFIQSYVNSVEAKLTSGNVSASGYRDLVDIDSYIDWWFVYEMTSNWEPNHPKSSYMYKDGDLSSDSRLHAGPCWDFDYATYLPERRNTWVIKGSIWYGYLFNDPAFVARVKEKWAAQKDAYVTVANSYLDAIAADVKASVTRDKIKWPCDDPVNGDNQMSYDDAVKRMKDALNDKISWMTAQIEMM